MVAKPSTLKEKSLEKTRLSKDRIFGVLQGSPEKVEVLSWLDRSFVKDDKKGYHLRPGSTFRRFSFPKFESKTGYGSLNRCYFLVVGIQLG